MKHSEAGFTTVEVLVAVAIVGILVVVAFPSIASLVSRMGQVATRQEFYSAALQITEYWEKSEYRIPGALNKAQSEPPLDNTFWNQPSNFLLSQYASLPGELAALDEILELTIVEDSVIFASRKEPQLELGLMLPAPRILYPPSSAHIVELKFER